MIIVLILLAFMDAIFLPVQGRISSVIFVLIVCIAIWREKNYRSYFLMALIFITLASAIYLMGGGIIGNTGVQKLSDWSLTFLLLGVLKLAWFSNSKHDSKINKGGI